MPSMVRGQVATNDLLAAQLVVDMDREVYEIDKRANPVMTLISRESRSKEANATTINWMEDEPVPMWTHLNGSINGSVTSITVDDSSFYQVGDLLKVVATGEIMRVTAVPTGTTASVTRGYAGASGTSASDNAYVLNLRAAEMEGDVAPDAISTVKAAKLNYMQIVRTPVHLTNTAQAVEHYSGDELRYQQRKAGVAHARAWEEIFLHGRKKEDTSTGSAPIRLAGGIDEFVTTNLLDANGTLTEPEFIDWLGDGPFRYSPNGDPGSSKWLFASRDLLNTINGWGLAKLQLASAETAKYGMDIMQYVTGLGVLKVVNHPLLEQGYGGYGYVIDPASIIRRPLSGRSTKLLTNRQDNSEDGRKDEYLTEQSFQVVTEKANGIIFNVSY